MISILICSVNSAYLAAVRQNIAATAGVEHEILTADNRGTQKGICQVYNELAAAARYPYLVFVHEDVQFNKKNWGRELCGLFETLPNTGAIGIAGSHYKSKSISGWHTNIAAHDAYHIMHITNGTQHPLIHYRPEKKEVYPAVCLDGVFIATTKANWQQVKFNEEKLKGFHFYDLDFSMRTYLAGKNVWIWMDLGLEHFTVGGDFGTPWVKEALWFHQYMQPHLPKGKLAAGTHELNITNWWLDFLKIFPIEWKLKWQWMLRQQLYRHPATYYNLLKFWLYTPLGLKALHRWLKKGKSTSQ
jgi:hypothetical protein